MLRLQINKGHDDGFLAVEVVVDVARAHARFFEISDMLAPWKPLRAKHTAAACKTWLRRLCARSGSVRRLTSNFMEAILE
jgi:hypothetical protein